MNFERIEHGSLKCISEFATAEIIYSVMSYISKLSLNLELIIFHVEMFGVDSVDSSDPNAVIPADEWEEQLYGPSN